jgi:lipoprotein-anchoring transpeptidase ErfK/SrfK
MRKLAIGVSAFVLGGISAGAMALIDQPAIHGAAGQASPRSRAPANQPERVMLSDASVRQAMAQGLVDRPIKSILNVAGKLSYGDFRWNERSVPQGPLWIRVDLQSQLVSVFRAGHEIGTAVILYGADGVATPVGKFPILAKLKDHRSATYDAPMPYTLRLTGDGVSIHASNVRWGYATHGCIGVPEAFAAKLFAAASVGDEVSIVSGISGARQQA